MPVYKKINVRVVFLSVVTLFVLTSCGNKKDGFELRFNHIANEDNTWHKAAIKFKELVEERSAGKVTVDVHPNINEMKTISAIQLGDADMTITGESLQNLAPKAALMAIPYAFESSKEMRTAANSEAAKQITDQITEGAGLVPLTWFERGPRHLTSNRPIKNPDELNNLSLRVPKVPIFREVWKGLGAIPQSIEFNEVFDSLNRNTVEAQENPLSLIYSESFYEVQKYVNLTAHVRSWIYVVIGKEKLESMPPELQDIVREAAKEMQSYENKLFIEEEKKLRAKLEKAGMTFVEVDQAAFSKKAQATIMEQLKDEQKALLEQLKANN